MLSCSGAILIKSAGTIELVVHGMFKNALGHSYLVLQDLKVLSIFGSNMSKTSASVLSGVPNTEKQMKA